MLELIDSALVLNSNSANYKDQKYEFFEVDRKKLIIKLKENLDNLDFVDMIIDNVLKNIKTNFKKIGNDLVLVSVEQNIDERGKK